MYGPGSLECGTKRVTTRETKANEQTQQRRKEEEEKKSPNINAISYKGRFGLVRRDNNVQQETHEKEWGSSMTVVMLVDEHDVGRGESRRRQNILVRIETGLFGETFRGDSSGDCSRRPLPGAPIWFGDERQVFCRVFLYKRRTWRINV